MDLLLMLTTLLRTKPANIDRMMRALLLRALDEGECVFQLALVKHPWLNKYANDVMVMWRNREHVDLLDDRFWLHSPEEVYDEYGDDRHSLTDLPYARQRVRVSANDNDEDTPTPHYGSYQRASMSWRVYLGGINEGGKQYVRKDSAGRHYYARSGGHGKRHKTLRTHRDPKSRRS